MPVYEIDSPNKLTAEDWDDLRGTNLFEQMFRNRVRVNMRALNPQRLAGAQLMRVWLEERVEGLYYFNEQGVLTVYFEVEAEMIAFTLTFKGEELPVDDSIPAPNVGRPVQPHTSGGGLPPTPNPPHRSGGGQPWALPSRGIWENPLDDDIFRAKYGSDTWDRVRDLMSGLK